MRPYLAKIRQCPLGDFVWGAAIVLLMIPATPARGLGGSGQIQTDAGRMIALSQHLHVQKCHVGNPHTEAFCGSFDVPENRSRPGRVLSLSFVMLPSRADPNAAEPIFYLVGGPGQSATDFAQRFEPRWGWLRQNHDVFLVDQRGTEIGHRLSCDGHGSAENLEGYLEIPFNSALASECKKKLQSIADLTQYSTFTTVEDIDDFRKALGATRITLVAGSAGTFAALTYIRYHRDRVGSAVLFSLAVPEDRAPLNHAASAQRAFDLLVRRCGTDSCCSRLYPNLRKDMALALQRLRKAPVRARVQNPFTGAQQVVRLTEPAFVDAVRVMLYGGGSELPALLSQAASGDFDPFAQSAIKTSTAFYGQIAIGLFYSITCTESVRRIREGEVSRATEGTFYGQWRVRSQMAACAKWPRTQLPKDFFSPFQATVPVILVSGEADPVTPPKWGAVAQRYLPNSVHLVVPGSHTPVNDCVATAAQRLFDTHSVREIDTGCLASLPADHFTIPASEQRKCPSEYSVPSRLVTD